MKRTFCCILSVICFISCALICHSKTNQSVSIQEEQVFLSCDIFSQDILDLAKSDPYFFYIVDKEHFLPANYKPDDLIKDDYILARKATHEAFNKMKEAAQKDGINIWIVSGFRDYVRQEHLYNTSIQAKGIEHANKYLAKPGASQHQLGTAVDINSVQNSFADTKECKWLEKNAEKFGFSLSFPKGQEEKTGYAFEPWHYRYITPEGTTLQKKYFNNSQVDFLDTLNACIK